MRQPAGETQECFSYWLPEQKIKEALFKEFTQLLIRLKWLATGKNGFGKIE